MKIATLNDLFNNCIPEPNSGCWLWAKGIQSMGYGQIYIKGKVLLAHRVAKEIAIGKPIPRGIFVLHKCDNPICVNPDHLFLGTQKDNLQDCSKKGRTVTPCLKGEQHNMRKLTDTKVILIRAD